MIALREHIASKISIIILVAALLTPSVVKLHHLFEDHAHAVCVNPQDTHWHEVDLDCEFYKFKLNTQFSHSFVAVDLSIVENDYEPFISFEQLVRSHSVSQYYLRGPPELI